MVASLAIFKGEPEGHLFEPRMHRRDAGTFRLTSCGFHRVSEKILSATETAPASIQIARLLKAGSRDSAHRAGGRPGRYAREALRRTCPADDPEVAATVAHRGLKIGDERRTDWGTGCATRDRAHRTSGRFSCSIELIRRLPVPGDHFEVAATGAYGRGET